MFKKLLIIIPFALSIGVMQAMAFSTPSASSSSHKQEVKTILAQHEISLANRYAVPSVNTVFKDNILLNLAYLSGDVKNPSQINWDTLHKKSSYEFVLQPGEVFAYHDDILPAYRGKVVRTTNAHFNQEEGFKTDGLYYGDGVCHFASLITWVAKDAGLNTIAHTNHNFARIPEIPMQFGTSIYANPGESTNDQMQNLYVENNLKQPVKFVFTYENDILKLTIEK